MIAQKYFSVQDRVHLVWSRAKSCSQKVQASTSESYEGRRHRDSCQRMKMDHQNETSITKHHQLLVCPWAQLLWWTMLLHQYLVECRKILTQLFQSFLQTHSLCCCWPEMNIFFILQQWGWNSSFWWRINSILISSSLTVESRMDWMCLHGLCRLLMSWFIKGG